MTREVIRRAIERAWTLEVRKAKKETEAQRMEKRVLNKLSNRGLLSDEESDLASDNKTEEEQVLQYTLNTGVYVEISTYIAN